MSIIPKGLTYIDNFISKEEETFILDFLHKQKWESKEIKRQTQQYGYRYSYYKSTSESTLAQEVPPIPKELNFLLERLKEKTTFDFDQLIVNRYFPGEGINPHIDNTDLFDHCVVSISLLSDVPMNFALRDESIFIQELKRYSAAILEKDARYKWTHSISQVKKDRKERISLTFRILKNKKRKQI